MHIIFLIFTLDFILQFSCIPLFGYIPGTATGAPNDNFRKIVCSEDDLRSRIFGSFSEKFLIAILSARKSEQMKNF